MSRVALVCMPFYRVEAPPISLGLLKSILRERGIACDLHHLHLLFADNDIEGYSAINEDVSFHGEWIFSHALYGEVPELSEAEVEAALLRLTRCHHRSVTPLCDEALDAVSPVRLNLQQMERGRYRGKVRGALGDVEPFLDRCMTEVDWSQYAVVGFTSTFQQHVASLALAKRIKAAYPDVYIILGGGNCDGVMGEANFREFPFIDGVCYGEGDVAFPEFLEDYLAGAPARPIAGILDRRLEGRGRALPVFDAAPRLPRPPFTDLDTLPTPDYDDFLSDVDATSFGKGDLIFYFESSRGCWWGQKNHCTFCGVNGGAMDFRTKSADRAVAEIRELHARYGHRVSLLAATDNIMPVDYVKTALPALQRLQLGADIFYETKANVRKEQLEVYHRAGVKHIQPGIESLSTRVLRLMKKGVTRLQNVQFLKWARQYNIDAGWNVLYGFPGEIPEDYADHPALFENLHHLTPPIVCVPIRFDRFSPYFERAEDYGIEDLRPHPAYAEIYRDASPERLHDLAYNFVGDYPEQGQFKHYGNTLNRAVQRWQERARDAALVMMDHQGRLVLGDFRGDAPAYTTLVGAARLLYLACDRIQHRRRLAGLLVEHHGGPVSARRLDELLAPLLAKGLMIEEDERVLSLALSLDDALPDPRTYFPPPSCWPHLSELMSLLDAA